MATSAMPSGAPSAPGPQVESQTDAAWAEPPAEDLQDDTAAEHECRRSVVTSAQHGLRLDKALVALAGEFSRGHLQSLIERGHVRLDGAVQDTPARKLKVGQVLELDLVPTAESLAFRPEPMHLPIVFEDAHLLVLDKPAGLVVHPAVGHWSGTLLNGLLAHHAEAQHLPRAGIVHRLDKDTTGLMVVAKTLPAMTALVRAIAAREVKRHYLALAHGGPAWAELAVDAPIGRDPAQRLRMAVVTTGKSARTDFTRLGLGQLQGRAVVALQCRLHTGRTHQIRVHLAHKGHPLVGDVLYGGKVVPGLQRQALHAAELAFAHPQQGGLMQFEAALPGDLAQAWAQIMGDSAAVKPTATHLRG